MGPVRYGRARTISSIAAFKKRARPRGPHTCRNRRRPTGVAARRHGEVRERAKKPPPRLPAGGFRISASAERQRRQENGGDGIPYTAGNQGNGIGHADDEPRRVPRRCRVYRLHARNSHARGRARAPAQSRQNAYRTHGRINNGSDYYHCCCFVITGLCGARGGGRGGTSAHCSDKIFPIKRRDRIG